MSEIQGVPPPDTAPENALPLPTPPTPTPPSTPSLETLRSWAPLYLSKADAVVIRLNNILTYASGTDTVLCALCYTSLLSSSVLSSLSVHQLHNRVLSIIEKAIALPPNTTLVISASSLPSSRLLTLSKRLKALSGLISDYRIFTRLWALLGLWRWVKGLFTNRFDDKYMLSIVYMQAVLNIFYQVLENGAYLASKGVLGWSPEKQSRAWLWSSRFWMAHVGLDFLKLAHQWNPRKEKEEKEGKETEQQKIKDEEERARFWTKQMVVSLAYAPLTVHWSLEKGLFGDFWVGVFGSVAGLTELRSAWWKARPLKPIPFPKE